MNPKAKTIVKFVLLIFVGGSVIYALNQELRRQHPPSVLEQNSAPFAKNDLEKSLSLKNEIDSRKSDNQIIAYYFHGNARCTSCLLIEKYSYAAISKEFTKEIETGKISWKVVNVENPAHHHFIQDYQLHTKSVVLSLVQNGKEDQWKNLEKVWEYVQNEKQFHAYITDEVAKFVEALPR